MVRKFDTGATRSSEDGKLDLEGFLDPLVLERYAQYMHKHRVQEDGALRASDNWKRGIPKDTYIKSAHRHFLDFWKEHRGHKTEAGLEESICATMFNLMGYLYETLKEEQTKSEPKQREEKGTSATSFQRNCS